ncbi:50S ribosomal protein L29 [Candidatus Dojkabacteria bacterium]|jgi:ribosomal protein L29|nr:50S ribosomal protein L29 [Candidatus Dojkabacteria bacterium]
MKATAIRKMEKVAIDTEVKKEREQLNEISQSVRLGKEKNVRKTLQIRRNIARMLTVLKEMNLSK